MYILKNYKPVQSISKKMLEETTQEKFPHLLPEESQIWRRFLDTLGGNYDYFSYDVRVGKGAPLGNEKDEKYRKMWTDLTQKRIDAIGFSKDTITIFEIRPRAGLPMMGKLLGYKELLMRTHHISEKFILAIVSDRVDDDDATVFSANGIQIFIV